LRFHAPGEWRITSPAFDPSAGKDLDVSVVGSTVAAVRVVQAPAVQMPSVTALAR